MPIEDSIGLASSPFFTVEAYIKPLFLLMMVFYLVFSFILYRQVVLLSVKIPSEFDPILKFIATIHLGISFALLFVMIGIF